MRVKSVVAGLREAWAVFAIAGAIVGGFIGISHPELPGVGAVVLLVVAALTGIMLVGSSPGVWWWATVGCIFMIPAIVVHAWPQVALFVLATPALLWLILQIWLIRSWWKLYSLMHESVPRVKYLPALVGMSATIWIVATTVSWSLTGHSLSTSTTLALGATPWIDETTIDSVVRSLRTVVFLTYVLLAVVTLLYATFSGDTLLKSRTAMWRVINTRDLHRVRRMLRTRQVDHHGKAVLDQIIYQLVDAWNRLLGLISQLWLTIRSLPDLMAAAIIDLFSSIVANILGAVLIFLMACLGAPAGVLSGAILAAGMCAAIGHLIGMSEAVVWSAMPALGAVYFSMFWLAAIAEFRGFVPIKISAANIGERVSARETAPAINFFLRWYAVAFIALPLAVCLACVAIKRIGRGDPGDVVSPALWYGALVSVAAVVLPTILGVKRIFGVRRKQPSKLARAASESYRRFLTAVRDLPAAVRNNNGR